MIQLIHIHKYFNRRRRNQIHVINDTSLEFPSTGLVCLLGASGSGKTTLLNVIGGLDKASGQIIYDDITLKNYSMTKVDKMRRKNMGYIFQNYNLFPDMTVYDNLKFALSLAEIYDKEEIDKRINYCLDAVGMLKYKRRKAIALSGGQQQRVAIARALVKKTKVIIADEPTGNLDSNNTIEVMNIIKKISESTLVILVTHERKIASFYADRIIEIQDGKVLSDQINENQESLSHQDDRVIHLKDLNVEQHDYSNLHFHYYFDEKDAGKIHFKVVYKDGALIIDVNSNAKVKYVGQGSDVILKDDHYQEIQKTDISLSQYDNSFFEDKRGHFNYLRKLWSDFKVAFANFFFVKLRHKFMYAGFFVIGMLIAFMAANYSNIFTMDKRNLDLKDASVLTIQNQDSIPVDFASYETQEHIVEVARKYDYTQLRVDISNNFQTKDQMLTIYNHISIIPSSVVQSNELIKGKLPTQYNEAAIDQFIADKMIKEGTANDITSYDDVLGRVIWYRNSDSLDDMKITITGIYQRDSFSVALNEEGKAFFNFRSSYEYERYQVYEWSDALKIKEGRTPSNTGEVLVHEMEGYAIDSQFTLSNKTFTVVGIYEGSSDNKWEQFIYILMEDIISLYDYQNISSIEFDVFSLDKNKTKAYFEDLGFKVVDARTIGLERAQSEWIAQSIAALTFVGVLAAGVFVFLYFMMRSRMIDRIYTIGVYRALGASRSKVVGLFFMEVFVLTTFTTFLGYAVMAYLISYVNSSFADIGTILYFPWYNVTIGIVLLYGSHLLFGLLPSFLLLRKTPSQILSKYDI